jgi:hypothetical protein
MDALIFYWDFNCLFFNNKENPYSTFGFSFWTFINVQNRKSPGGFENDPKKMRSEHNALITKKIMQNM